MQQNLLLVLSFLFVLQGCGGVDAPAPQGAPAAPGAATQPTAGQEKQDSKTEEPTTASKSGEGLNSLPKRETAAQIRGRLRVNELLPTQFQQSTTETNQDIFQGIVGFGDEISIESQSYSGELILYSFSVRDYKTGQRAKGGKRVLLNIKTGEQKDLPYNQERYAFLSLDGKFFTCVTVFDDKPMETTSYDLATGALIAKHMHRLNGTYWNVKKSAGVDRILMYSGSRLYSVDMKNFAASEFLIDDADNVKMENITVNSAGDQVLYFSWRNNATPFHRLFDLNNKTHSDSKDLFNDAVDFNDKYVIFRNSGRYSYALKSNLLNGNTEKTTINLNFPNRLVGGLSESNEFMVFDGNSYVEYDLDKNVVKKSFFHETQTNTSYGYLFSNNSKKVFVSKIVHGNTSSKSDSTGDVSYGRAQIYLVDTEKHQAVDMTLEEPRKVDGTILPLIFPTGFGSSNTKFFVMDQNRFIGRDDQFIKTYNNPAAKDKVTNKIDLLATSPLIRNHRFDDLFGKGGFSNRPRDYLEFYTEDSSGNRFLNLADLAEIENGRIKTPFTFEIGNRTLRNKSLECSFSLDGKTLSTLNLRVAAGEAFKNRIDVVFSIFDAAQSFKEIKKLSFDGSVEPFTALDAGNWSIDFIGDIGSNELGFTVSDSLSKRTTFYALNIGTGTIKQVTTFGRKIAYFDKVERIFVFAFNEVHPLSGLIKGYIQTYDLKSATLNEKVFVSYDHAFRSFKKLKQGVYFSIDDDGNTLTFDMSDTKTPRVLGKFKVRDGFSQVLVTNHNDEVIFVYNDRVVSHKFN